MAKSADLNVEEMIRAARAGADESIRTVLDTQFPDWFKSFRAGFMEWAKANPDKEASKFSFTLAMVLKIKPAESGQFDITAAAGFSVKHKAISNPARVQLELQLKAA
jgi:hypothetical protein